MLPYFPGLRFKQGEYLACAKLPAEIQNHFVPRFIIPPPKERDPELERIPTPDEIAYLTGQRIGKHWWKRPAYLDPQYVSSALGDAGLVRMFEIAHGYNSNLIPIARTADLHNPTFRRLVNPAFPQLGLYVHFEDIDIQNILDGLLNIGIAPSETVIFADFTGADLEPERAAGPIGFVFDTFAEAAPWKKIAFQASAFPKRNPAGHGQSVLLPRNEKKAFIAGIKESSVPSTQIAYGDYAADCGEMSFPKQGSGGIAIRHLRYTTPTDTLVVRGVENGNVQEIFRDVCRRLVSSPHFAGHEFSYADLQIWRISKGFAGCGTASMWREWNTAHHITREIHDLGRPANLKFAKVPVDDALEQLSLLADDY